MVEQLVNKGFKEENYNDLYLYAGSSSSAAYPLEKVFSKSIDDEGVEQYNIVVEIYDMGVSIGKFKAYFTTQFQNSDGLPFYANASTYDPDIQKVLDLFKKIYDNVCSK